MTIRSSFLALFAALALLPFGGCSCDDPPVAGADSLPELEPSSLVFSGEACAGSSAKQTVVVSNKSRGQLNGTLSIEGKDAEDFRIAEEDREISLTGLGSKEIEVFFEPREPSTGKGPKALEATLVLRSNSERQPVVDTTLDGQVSNLPVEPRFAAEWEVCHNGGEDAPPIHCEGNPGGQCCDVLDSVNFGRVSVDAEEEATALLQIRNESCGELRITKVEEVVNEVSSECGEGVLEWPDLEEKPLVLAGKSTETIEVKFRPTKDCTLERQLVFHSNDEENPTLSVALRGEGIQAFLTYVPKSLLFDTVEQGKSKSLSTTGTNRGGEAIVVEAIRIQGPSKEHFRITSVESCGNNLELDADGTLRDGPLSLLGKPGDCEREVKITVEYAPKGPGVHSDTGLYVEHDLGTDKVPLNGRSSPKLVAQPAVIAFDTPAETGCGGLDDYACGSCKNQTTDTCQDDDDCLTGEVCLDGACTADHALCITTCGQAVRTFRLVNEGVGDLVISKLRLEDLDGNEGGPVDPMRDSDTYGEPVFQLEEGSCKNATVKPGESCEGRIHVTDNRSGGKMEAILRVESNDPAWEDGMPIEIVKNSVAPLQPDVRFPRPSFPTVDEWVRLDASGSTAKQGTLTRFEWKVSTAQSTTKLPRGTIDPADPNKGCQRPDGECYRLLNANEAPCASDGSDCSILEFKPDLSIVYTIEVTAHGSICSPPYERSWSEDISPVTH